MARVPGEDIAHFIAQEWRYVRIGNSKHASYVQEKSMLFRPQKSRGSQVWPCTLRRPSGLRL